jgi:hypothetical protein
MIAHHVSIHRSMGLTWWALLIISLGSCDNRDPTRISHQSPLTFTLKFSGPDPEIEVNIREINNLPYIHAIINGKDMMVLIDSGNETGLLAVPRSLSNPITEHVNIAPSQDAHGTILPFTTGTGAEIQIGTGIIYISETKVLPQGYGSEHEANLGWCLMSILQARIDPEEKKMHIRLPIGETREVSVK